MVKGMCKASTVIEMAYMMPIVLLAWVLIVFALFYFHDKNIISGAAYETCVVGSERIRGKENMSKEEVTSYFQKRIHGKLLFFSGANAEVEMKDDRITVTAKASKRGMRVNVSQSAAVITPEEELRMRRILKEGLEGLIR